MTDQALTTTEAPRPKTAITVGGNVGALIPQDIEQAFRIASALAHSGMAPSGFQTPEKCFVAIMAGAELGLPPFQSLQSFAIINGRPTIYGAALMAVIRTNGFKVREWFEGEGDDLTAFCEVTRPDNGDKAEASYSVADAKTAKLWGKAGPWTTSPKRMLQWRARGFSFNDGAADVLKGLQIREVVQDDEPLPEEPTRATGTGLLGKLEATQTLATEGFGIRDVSDEAGAAAPAPETKPKRPRKKAVDDALNAAGDEMAAQAAHDAKLAAAEETFDPVHPDDRAAKEAERSSPAAMVQGDGPAIPASEEELAVFDAEEEAAEAAERAENLPADAQVEETGATTPDPDEAVPADLVLAHPEPDDVIEGPAPADTIYFLAGEEPYPSGRRAVWFNGKLNGSEDAASDFPVYTQHPGEQASEPSAPKQAESAAETPVEPATAEDEVGAELSPLHTFDAAIDAATTADALVEAMTALFATDDFKTADQKRIPRQRLWARVAALNDAGAKIDPVKFPYIMGSFVEASSDIEAIEALLVLARDEEWFKAGGEGMQTAVARAVMDRVAVLKGGA